MKYHRGFALYDRFAINDQHAWRENVSKKLQRAIRRDCYQIEGRDMMKIKAGGFKNNNNNNNEPKKPNPNLINFKKLVL